MNIHQQIGPILNEMAEEQARLWILILNVYTRRKHYKILCSEMADLAQQLEAEAMADMFNKMVDSCHYKCIGLSQTDDKF